MSESSTGDERRLPQALTSPHPIEEVTKGFGLWSGKTELTQGEETQTGNARVFVEMATRPEIRFEFESEQPPSIHDMFSSNLNDGEIVAGDLLGQVRVGILNSGGRTFSGLVYVEEPDRNVVATTAKYLVINGPDTRGMAIQSCNTSYTGRMQSSIGDAEVTVDAIVGEKLDRTTSFGFSHVAQIHFNDERNYASFASIESHLFRTLSLMKQRWVGILGPWLYSKSHTVRRFVPHVTKVSRNRGSHSWCHDTIGDPFSELFPCMNEAFSDPERSEALQTGFHWLIETEMCAGGVEGSLVLQQAALESLAWCEIVKRRKLCSTSGFNSLPAADKIRWLLSLFSIPTAIPQQSSEIDAYAREFNLHDLPEVLADVRNALVHGTPKKVEKLFSRGTGDDERTELWYQVGGLLSQCVLAIVGYKGRIMRRDIDTEWAASAIRPVPWSSKE